MTIDFREDLKKCYRRNIESAELELKGCYQDIRRLKHIIAENRVVLNSITYCQLSIEKLLEEN